MEKKTFYSTLAGKKLDFDLFLPPHYGESEPAHQVLYRLWGSMPDGLEQEEIEEETRRLVQSGSVIPMIVVGFRGDGNILVKELLPFIDRNFRTIAAREGRAVEGFLDAGADALATAMEHPGLFASVGSYQRESNGSKDYTEINCRVCEMVKSLGNNLNVIRGRLRIHLIWEGVFFEDNLNDKVHRELDKVRIPHVFQTVTGLSAENGSDWKLLVAKELYFHSEELQFVKFEDISKPAGNTLFHSNLKYTEVDGLSLRLDLYLPEKSRSLLPLIVWIHGGGWMVHSKEYYVPAFLVERGYAIASINYRLTRHAIFPAQLEDCKTAIRWLRAHAFEYGLDTERFGVWGNSAGGHLAALTGTTGNRAEFDKGENLELSSKVQAVCDYYGPVDMLKMHHGELTVDHLSATSAEARLLGCIPGEHPEKAAAANPITYIDSNMPPFLILHGDKDEVVHYSQSTMLYDALKQAGTEAELHILENAEHGFEITSADISPVNDKVTAFFDSYLKRTAIE